MDFDVVDSIQVPGNRYQSDITSCTRKSHLADVVPLSFTNLSAFPPRLAVALEVETEGAFGSLSWTGAIKSGLGEGIFILDLFILVSQTTCHKFS